MDRSGPARSQAVRGVHKRVFIGNDRMAEGVGRDTETALTRV